MKTSAQNKTSPTPNTSHTDDPTAGEPRTLHTAVILTIEIFVAILLVLVFYIAFLQVLQFVFPTGSTSGLMGSTNSQTESTGITQRAVRNLLLLHGEQESSLDSPDNQTAVLTQTHKTVKSKRADTIAWSASKLGMALYDRDAVQTFDESSASIAFDDKNVLELGANTLVIIKSMEKDKLLQQKRSFLVVADGELRGKVMGSGTDSVDLQVTMPGGVAQIQSPQNGESPSDFKIAVKPDQSAVVTVYNGSASIALGGVTTKLQKNQGMTISSDGSFQPASALPDAPVSTAPTRDQAFVYGELAPRIPFTWKASPKMTRYRFVLARDPDFRERIADETLTKSSFLSAPLASGDYYWKVSGTSGDYESADSETWHFQVRQDHEPPALTVKFPPGIAYRSDYILRGTTESNAKVFVNGKAVRLAEDGTFNQPITLKPGINIIVVKAVVNVYNAAHRSQIVYGKF